MKKALLVAVVLVVSLAAVPTSDPSSSSQCSMSFGGSEAQASPDSCTGWMKQPSGCSFRTCVNGRGIQYCQEACGHRINRVRCQ